MSELADVNKRSRGVCGKFASVKEATTRLGNIGRYGDNSTGHSGWTRLPVSTSTAKATAETPRAMMWPLG